MSFYNYSLRQNADLCHYFLASEKDHGVQSIILRNKSPSDITKKYLHVVKSLCDSKMGQGKRDVVFLQVASPAKAFDTFDAEKYKIILGVDAYFKLLHFFQSDWQLVKNRLDSDYNDIKTNLAWISLSPSVSFRGPADIVYQATLDTSNTFALNLVVTRQHDKGKTNITVTYTDENLGSVHLPSVAMTALAKDLTYLKTLYEYKEGLILKRS